MTSSSFLTLVDAFADGPFTGNPAAVCLLEKPANEAWMQRLAMEMNQAETAYVYPEDQTGSFHLRWFTPKAEVDLCGHATLAAAHALWQANTTLPPTIVFTTRSGQLTAKQNADSTITLDFPAQPPQFERPHEDLAKSMNIDPAQIVAIGHTRFDGFIHVASAHTVRNCTPNLPFVAALPMRGVIVTADSDLDGVDFVSRFFAPGVGVPEDPVTGSAHCTLSPYWALLKGRKVLTGRQLSARGGTVCTRVDSNRVQLSGSAVTILHATLQPEALVGQ